MKQHVLLLCFTCLAVVCAQEVAGNNPKIQGLIDDKNDPINSLVDNYVNGLTSGDQTALGNGKATIVRNDNLLTRHAGKGKSFESKMKKSKEETNKIKQEDEQKNFMEEKTKKDEDGAKTRLQKLKDEQLAEQNKQEVEEGTKATQEADVKGKESEVKRAYEEKTKKRVRENKKAMSRMDEEAIKEREKENAKESDEKAKLEQVNKKRFEAGRARAEEIKEQMVAEAQQETSREAERKSRERENEEEAKQKIGEQGVNEEKAKAAAGEKEDQKLREEYAGRKEKKLQEQEHKKYLDLGSYRPQQGQYNQKARHVPAASTYSYMMWIKPLGIVHHHWGNIFHHGDHNLDRSPAVWFYPSSTRLHVRTSTSHDWNNGADPGEHLEVNRWTHVAISVFAEQVEVYLDGTIRARTHWGGQRPSITHGSLWASDPWHHAAQCEVADMRYYARSIAADDVSRVMNERKGIQ